MNAEVVIHADGGSRGNPGPAGAGAVVYENGHEVATVSAFLGTRTNNWAEYEALIRGLQAACDTVTNLTKKKVFVKLDSELIVKQMTGEYRVKDPELKKQHARVQALIASHIPHISFSHVRRELNERADELANHAMDSAA